MSTYILTASQAAIEMIAGSYTKITPPVLKKFLSQTLELNRQEIKTVIKNLVTSQEITYTYEYGTTFLEISFNKPVCISDRITLSPPECAFKPRPGEVVVKIRPGASFGAGQHPTTRLALRGLDFALQNQKHLLHEINADLLDIGTGSGVLAIAGVKLGIKKALGIDIDPCARFEARVNVSLNMLADAVEIGDLALENITQYYDVITANLRFPTLMRLCAKLFEITSDNGFIVLSGVKTDEIDTLLDAYQAKGFVCIWKENSKDWVGAVFQKVCYGIDNINPFV
ncbi:50S ribosomal protein L11 methyltransferase [Desulfococcaceae bacterium HSG9]|nr:50S ribosomal protein L11 methyltransferase [Desulfococcaceae bacterium HSG9]